MPEITARISLEAFLTILFVGIFIGACGALLLALGNRIGKAILAGDSDTEQEAGRG